MPTSWMHAFVDAPAEDVPTAHAFWSSVLGWPVGDPWPGQPEFTSFVPDGGAPGTVVAQSLKPKSKVKAGTEVTIDVVSTDTPDPGSSGSPDPTNTGTGGGTGTNE
jgi:predicted enzyme related to lactoylglutathione lyase